MSVSKPPIVASSVALLAALSLIPSQGLARDGQRVGDDVIYEMAPMSSDSTHDIIFQMPPLKPVKGAAQAAKTAPKPAEQPSPAVAAKPDLKPSIAPAFPAQATPAQPVQPAVAEAQKPATPSLAERPAAPEAEALPQQEAAPQPAQAAGESPAPADQETASSPPSAEQPVVAQTPTLVEPAPIGPPIMILNTPRKSLAGLSAPLAAFDPKAMDLQGGSAAPRLVPSLESSAPVEPPPAIEEPLPETADAGRPAEIPTGADAGAQAQQTSDEGASAPAQDDIVARIGAILAEGVVGPAEVRLADRATMWLPAGRVFLPVDSAKKLAKEAGLEWREGIQGMVAPAGDGLEWLAPVELVDDGYIPTGEPESLQADKLLAAFQASLPEVNAQRARVGQPPVTLDGWLTAPSLDAKHRLSACVNIATPNDQNGMDGFFNCEGWALGRHGAIKVGLADGVEMAERLKNEAAALAETIVFDHGATYEDFDAAADQVAPYSAADLLTRDVAAKAVKPVPAPQEGAPAPSILDRISGLLYPALFGVAALGLYVFLKRRRREGGEEGPQQERAETVVAGEAKPEPAELPPASLFARLLPSLHARLANKAEKAPEQAPTAETRFNAVLGALKSKFVSVMNAKKDKTPKADAASAENIGEEPISALKKLAARMRRTSEEAPPPPVNITRIVRTPRILGGAAPALAEEFVAPLIVDHDSKEAPDEGLLEPELIEPGQTAEPLESEAAHVAAAQSAGHEAAGVFDEDDFGLVEPGDAASAASARARLAIDE
ncbi:DUF2167 domain-containing protein [Methylocystis sp. MJC1]|uniref:DUF2167 domain-containing protein n=1 Tax=Methylocystis sp. MJC1 TaxID=2654282 RepID=UPI0013EA19AC|nr:DUF2167 domain-containing protein [Methylocystis sp. MJC1]KAF2991543.1 hypothetical protein MJC1_01108 [Methylocystis sp. MJC1]MBU6527218.1 DUF2167 domain-containing protein [Methylocystis sp. MJC1]UZX13646.1 DUF2167 domain-containing protein [Methylocystis sp. MJC1]